MPGKGENPDSFQKHERIAQLAKMQAARARNFLRPGARVVIIDMHAGDGHGVTQPQGDLFRGSESTPTARLAIEISTAMREARPDVTVDVFLCEKVRKRRKSLEPFSGSATILTDHRKLPPLGRYAWGIVFNDPNGPSKHGVELMQRLAGDIARLDFIIVVNEGALGRIAGVRGASTDGNAPIWATDADRARAIKDRYAWMTNPSQWARRLGRRHVLSSQSLYGSRAMKGRILLVTNAAPQRPQRNFSSVAVLGAAARAEAAPAKPETGTARRRDRGNPRRSGGFGF